MSHLVESNFRAQYSTGRFRAWLERYEFEPFQILCRAERAILLARYLRRAETGERHPGHLDGVLHGELMATMRDDDYRLMDIPGGKLTLDTTDLATVEYTTVLSIVQAARNKEATPRSS